MVIIATAKPASFFFSFRSCFFTGDLCVRRRAGLRWRRLVGVGADLHQVHPPTACRRGSRHGQGESARPVRALGTGSGQGESARPVRAFGGRSPSAQREPLLSGRLLCPWPAPQALAASSRSNKACLSARLLRLDENGAIGDALIPVIFVLVNLFVGELPPQMGPIFSSTSAAADRERPGGILCGAVFSVQRCALWLNFRCRVPPAPHRWCGA